MNLPTICPRCSSSNTVYVAEAATSTCLSCELDWWWSEDDQEVVTNG